MPMATWLITCPAQAWIPGEAGSTRLPGIGESLDLLVAGTAHQWLRVLPHHACAGHSHSCRRFSGNHPFLSFCFFCLEEKTGAKNVGSPVGGVVRAASLSAD